MIPTTRTTAVAAVAAPLLLLASTLSYVAEGDGMNTGEAGGAIQVWAFVAFAVAFVGFARRLEATSPRAASTVLLLGLVGVAGGVGYGIDSIQAALLDSESIQELDSVAASLALQIPGILFPVSLVALGLATARSGDHPAVAGYVLAVGAVLFPASRIPDVEALAVVADVLLVLSLGALAASLVQQPRRVVAPA